MLDPLHFGNCTTKHIKPKFFFSLQHGGQTFAAWSTTVATPVGSL